MRYILILAAVLVAGLSLYLALRWRGGWIPRLGLVAVALAVLAATGWRVMPASMPRHDDGSDLRALYTQVRPLPVGPVRTYHLGHSLVGRDMPAMLAQMAGHEYALQLGWGASLRSHHRGPEAVYGFAEENRTPHFRDPREALDSRQYGAFVMTEMVRLKDAILYEEAITYAGEWAALAAERSPQTEIFLYESWHGLEDPPDWLARIPDDFERGWSQLLWSAARRADKPVWLIPVGQVMARLVSEAEATGGIGEIKSREDLFARMPDGALDPIHPNDLGVYLVALTHYAVIYGRDPLGLPYELLRADGTRATAPSPELARRMQEITWEVVTSQPLTGVTAGP
ncbi:hypothetical protein [Paracoccus ravus]|uniref:hypothetical protein n=1 Tax=Paracoccus ravus TaxID=2447760 RepID=UPI00106E06E3|nr:hypothetical protein [Paracoccus ravus]